MISTFKLFFNFIHNPLKVTKDLYHPGQPIVHHKLGPLSLCQVNDFDLAKDLILSHPSTLIKPGFYHFSAKLFKADGILVVNGDKASEARKWGMESVNPKNFQDFESQLHELLPAKIDKWEREISLEMREKISDLTLHVIWSLMLKFKNFPLTFTRDMEHLIDRSHKWFFPLRGIISGLLPQNWKSPFVLNRVRMAIKKSLLIPSETVEKNSLSFLIGGYEATASTVQWALEAMAESDRVSGEDLGLKLLNDQEGLDSLIKETLRFYPSGYIIMREATADLNWQGRTFKKGCIFIVPVVWFHRDERYFPDAHLFIAERFRDKRPPPQWIPFGLGHRFCLGGGYASIEVRAILQEILKKYKPVYKTGSIGEPYPHVSLRPSKESSLALVRRLPENLIP